jgi:hypothetical protein
MRALMSVQAFLFELHTKTGLSMQTCANSQATASGAGSLPPNETPWSGYSSTFSGSERHRPPSVGEIVDYRMMRITMEGRAWMRGYAIFWVVFDEYGNATRWGEQPSAPVGLTHGDFTDSMRVYNQAIHKPILDWMTGKPIEEPIIRRYAK